MSAATRKPRVDRDGFATRRVQCRRCMAIGELKYVPHGLSNPLITCGCIGQKPDFRTLTVAQFRELKRKQRATR